jgi:hypothetical protein
MTMAKQFFVAIAAAAATVFMTFAVIGWPSLAGGTEGDITQAKRYQAQQLSSKDVVLEDTEAHRFIQSDTFDRLLKDADARRLLNNPDIRLRLSDAAVSDPTFKNLLGDPAVGRALATPVFQTAIASPGFRAALLDLHFAFAMATGLRAPSGCDDFGCGANSPVVDGAAIAQFHELSLEGAPNAAGVALVGVRKDDTAYTLDVTGATVVARPRRGNAPVLAREGLKGLALDLRDRAGLRYTVRFAGTGATTYWAGPPDVITTYELTYTSTAEEGPRPLCAAGINKAILFGGDRYDSARKTVTATGAATRGWFNIACAGTALAKLFLTRHTKASQTMRTTAAERQAMLKMLTGDVCGDGTSFTVHREPLLWADANGLTRFVVAPASLEAVWNEHGAVCLDTPRRPELAAAIAARCGARLPRCGASAPRGYVTSANP